MKFDLGDLAILSALILVIFYGCQALQTMTDTENLIIPKAQWEQIRQDIQATECPEDKSAIAVAVEAPTGGGVVTIRCQ